MRYSSGMVFGIYDKIAFRHAALLRKAAELCDSFYIAVSSDIEVESLTKKPSSAPLKERMNLVHNFCRENGINGTILGDARASPADFVLGYVVDAYILSEAQYDRFGKELKRIISSSKLPGKVIIV